MIKLIKSTMKEVLVTKDDELIALVYINEENEIEGVVKDGYEVDVDNQRLINANDD